jgi:hypothetical protein
VDDREVGPAAGAVAAYSDGCGTDGDEAGDAGGAEGHERWRADEAGGNAADVDRGVPGLRVTIGIRGGVREVSCVWV